MTRILLVIALLLVGCEKKKTYSACTGASDCSVCTNCSRCKWCKAHRGQPCGVKAAKVKR